jgi:ribosomal protein S18 acetylase RimI-like enzyme
VREGLLARSGSDARRAYFRVAAADPDTFGFVTSDGEGITGFVLVTAAARRLVRRTALRHPRIWLRLAATSWRSPSIVAAGLRRLWPTRRSPVRWEAGVDPTLRLLDIAVIERARGRGHGRMLLTAALDETWRRGFDSIGLSVLDSNVDAIRLYERSGFRRIGGGRRDDGHAFQAMRLDRPATLPTERGDQEVQAAEREVDATRVDDAERVAG